MDKELLFKPRLAEADVDVPGIGTMRVRGLSRAEVMGITKAADQNMDGPRALVLERKMLAMALLDPELTEAEVGRWQQSATTGELDPVSTKVQELSGLTDDAPKSGVPAAGDGPGAGVRALPGPEAEPDGDGATGEPE